MAARHRNVGGPVRACGVGVALALCLAVPITGRAQGSVSTGVATTAGDTLDPLARALDAEDKRDMPRAAAAYREVLTRTLNTGNPDGDRLALAMLGLERVWAETGKLDSLVPIATRVLQMRPTDPTAHTVRLRSLITMARDDEARAAFLLWRRVAGTDAAPYREYARLLMQQGRTLAADSLLSEAGRLMGAGGALSGETAQLHVSLQRWGAAATSYREALQDQPWHETAALFGLQRTPAASRDSVRAALIAEPALLPARRLLSSLEFAWGEPRRAWGALSALPVNDSTVAAWRAFGERAEMNESWLVTRDAWTAVFEARKDLEAQQRAADAALRAGDAEGALALVRRSGARTADSTRLRALLGLEIAALGELGRGAEAQQRLDAAGAKLDPLARAALARPLVGAWLRAGDVARARAAMSGTDLEDDDELAGWLALYEGDLATARKRLVRAVTQRTDLVDALGILARTRVDRLPGLGQAFLLVARRDSAGASAQFARMADSVGPAAPALLAQAARLAGKSAAPALYERILREHAKSPEAPESLLAWARLLIAAGDKATAITKLEQLLVEYTGSALAPQARRELERLKGTVPPGDVPTPRGSLR